MQPKATYYRRNLPHIHPEGYPFFITFRLADSLPLDVLRELQTQREREINNIKNLSPEGIYEAEKKYFGRFDAQLDRCTSGPHWLEDRSIASIVVENIESMNSKYFQLVAYCIISRSRKRSNDFSRLAKNDYWKDAATLL